VCCPPRTRGSPFLASRRHVGRLRTIRFGLSREKADLPRREVRPTHLRMWNGNGFLELGDTVWRLRDLPSSTRAARSRPDPVARHMTDPAVSLDGGGRSARREQTSKCELPRVVHEYDGQAKSWPRPTVSSRAAFSSSPGGWRQSWLSRGGQAESCRSYSQPPFRTSAYGCSSSGLRRTRKSGPVSLPSELAWATVLVGRECGAGFAQEGLTVAANRAVARY
jgi:hypothetical protein